MKIPAEEDRGNLIETGDTKDRNGVAQIPISLTEKTTATFNNKRNQSRKHHVVFRTDAHGVVETGSVRAPAAKDT